MLQHLLLSELRHTVNLELKACQGPSPHACRNGSGSDRARVRQTEHPKGKGDPELIAWYG